jgi:hypothetical protein
MSLPENDFLNDLKPRVIMINDLEEGSGLKLGKSFNELLDPKEASV